VVVQGDEEVKECRQIVYTLPWQVRRDGPSVAVVQESVTNLHSLFVQRGYLSEVAEIACTENLKRSIPRVSCDGTEEPGSP